MKRFFFALAALLTTVSPAAAEPVMLPPLRVYDGLSSTTPLPRHFKLRFSSGVCADNAGAGTTDCTITGFTGVTTDSTLTGAGTGGSPLGLALNVDVAWLKSAARTLQIADSTVVGQAPVTLTVKGGSAASSVDSTNAANGNPVLIQGGSGGNSTAVGGGTVGSGASATLKGGSAGTPTAGTGIAGGATGGAIVSTPNATAGATGAGAQAGGAGGGVGGITVQAGVSGAGGAGGAGANGGAGGAGFAPGNTTSLANGGTLTFGALQGGAGGAAGSGAGNGGAGGGGSSVVVRSGAGGAGGAGTGGTNGGVGGDGGMMILGTQAGGAGGAAGSGTQGNGGAGGSWKASTANGGNGLTGGLAGTMDFQTGNAGTGGSVAGAGITMNVGTATGAGAVGVINIAGTRGNVLIGQSSSTTTVVSPLTLTLGAAPGTDVTGALGDSTHRFTQSWSEQYLGKSQSLNVTSTGTVSPTLASGELIHMATFNQDLTVTMPSGTGAGQIVTLVWKKDNSATTRTVTFAGSNVILDSGCVLQSTTANGILSITLRWDDVLATPAWIQAGWCVVQ